MLIDEETSLLSTFTSVSPPLLPHDPHPLSISTWPASSSFFLAPVATVLALRGVQALGSVKRLKTILLFWRYINKIELN